MGDLVSMRELSRRAGVTLRAIQVAVETGRIAPVKTEQRGKRTRVFFDADQAVADFHATRSEARHHILTRAEAGKGPQPDYKRPDDKIKDNAQVTAPAATPPGPPDPKNLKLFSAGDGPAQGAQAGPVTPQQATDGRAGYTLNPAAKKFHDHRAEREEYTAKMAALKYKTEAGELIASGPVKVLFFELGQKVQSNMLAIPGRVSAIIAAQQNEKKIYDLLTDEITQALESLSNTPIEDLIGK